MNAPAQSSHFNLHVSGIGYLNRIRLVETKKAGRKADPFLACSIAALRGNADQPDYTYFDLRVSGSEAINLVEKLRVDVEERRKVVVSFRVGDIYPHVYERDVKDRDGRKTGEKEFASLIKGRLLLINSITIDGENVYRRESQDEAHSDEAQALQDSDRDQDEQQDEPPQYQERAQRPALPSRSQEQQGGREYRSQAPRAIQPRQAQQPRPVPAPRQHGSDGTAAYRAGHAVGRVTRYVADRAVA